VHRQDLIGSVADDLRNGSAANPCPCYTNYAPIKDVKCALFKAFLCGSSRSSANHCQHLPERTLQKGSDVRPGSDEEKGQSIVQRQSIASRPD
jgi:hypothetical protein